MSTESKGKHRLTDMSIDPSTVKGKGEVTEVTQGGKKVLKVKKERKASIFYPSHHKGNHKVSNWVCVKKGDEVQKVARATVEKLIAQGWNYCPRKEWKTKVRDATQVTVASYKKEDAAPSKKSKPRKET
jgi:hypothetical protein